MRYKSVGAIQQTYSGPFTVLYAHAHQPIRIPSLISTHLTNSVGDGRASWCGVSAHRDKESGMFSGATSKK